MLDYIPPVKQLLRFFAFGHLPVKLQPVSAEFNALAYWIADNVPDSAEKTVSLRKLLEAKDAAVRACIPE